MNKMIIVALMLVAWLGMPVAAQEQSDDLGWTDIVAVAEELVDALAQAVAEAVSEAAADAEVPLDEASQDSADAETAEDIESQVDAEVEAAVDELTAPVADVLNDFLEQLRVFILTMVAIFVLTLGSFLAGLLLGVKRVEKLGCGIVIAVSLIAGVLAWRNLGAGAGIAIIIVAGFVLPFTGTIIAIVTIEAGRRWIALLRSLRAGFRR